MLSKRYARREYLKKKLLTTSANSTELEKTDKSNTQDTIIKFKSHSFKEKIYFKRKAIKQRDVKIKPSLTKHQTELLKDANTLLKGNLGTNFLFAYANVHRNLKIHLKDAWNGWEVVRFANEKDFNNLFAKSFSFSFELFI